MKDVTDLNENHLINCLGYSSKKIFNDSFVYGTKGHILVFTNPNKVKEFICLKHLDRSIKFYCFPDKVLVGLSSQISDNNQI